MLVLGQGQQGLVDLVVADDKLIGLLQVVKSYEDSDCVNHDGVLEVGRLRSETVQQLVTEVISRMEINNNIDRTSSAV